MTESKTKKAAPKTAKKAAEAPKKPAAKKAPAAKKTVKKTPAAEDDQATLALEPAPAKPKRTVKKKVAVSKEPAPAVEPVVTPEPVVAPAASVAPVAAPEPDPAPIAATPAPKPEPPPAPAPAPALTPAPAPAQAAAGRKYPVYVPRAVAKQLEAEGKTAPVAVTSPDELPEVQKYLAEQPPRSRHNAPATASQTPAEAPAPVTPSVPVAESAPAPAQPAPQPNQQRQGQQNQNRHQHQRPPKHERHDRHDRNDRQEKPREEEPLVLTGPVQEVEGIVEISGKGFGFLRSKHRDFVSHPQDIFVTPDHVRLYNLRDGQWLKGEAQRSNRGDQITKIVSVNDQPPERCRELPAFDELTVISPDRRFTLETVPERYTTRVIDLMAPIGKGQRGLIVSPPRVGKTTLLHHIADGVLKNHPETKLIILLVDERPEEVTDFKRTFPTAELYASSNDSDTKNHLRVSQLCIERAKRLVEHGRDVFILLDSITRLSRAFNNATAGGRTGSGGLDTRALEIPRRMFAAARNTEEAGSLTIIATALIETNSRMDEVIFQEFKGTGNMELMLDRKISDQRIYPAVDIFLSGTRREELLVPSEQLHKTHVIRRGLSGHKPIEAIERLLFFLKRFPNNAQMLREIPG